MEKPNTQNENSLEELKNLYQKIFGVSAESYFLTREEIEKAINNPEEERNRLYQLALEENRDDIDDLYRR